MDIKNYNQQLVALALSDEESGLNITNKKNHVFNDNDFKL